MKFASRLYRRSTAAALFVTVLSTGVSAQAAPTPSTTPSSTEQLYTVLVFETPASMAQRTNTVKSDAYWSSYDRFAEALAKAGALRGGSALSETDRTTVRGRGSADDAVKGTRLGGYFVIAASTRAQAEALARLAPAAAVTVELRAHRDNPHMMAPKR